MTVNGRWRICFEFRQGDAFDVAECVFGFRQAGADAGFEIDLGAIAGDDHP